MRLSARKGARTGPNDNSASDPWQDEVRSSHTEAML